MRRRMLASLGGGAKSWKNPYITDGLVAMWDGEWNAGGGVHDPEATVWKDIVGTDRITYVGSYDVADKGVYVGDLSYGISDQARSYENYTLHLNADIYSARTGSLGTDVFSYQRANVSDSNYGHPVFIGNGGSVASGLIEKTGRFDGVLDAVVTWDGYNASVATYKNGVYAGLISSSRRSEDVRVILNSLRTRTSNSMRRMFRSISIYNRCLSDSEIAANYEIDKARFGLP